MYRETPRDVVPLGLLVALLVFAVSACSEDEQQQESKARHLPEDEKALRPGE
jgi:hypothetical protein